MAGGEIGNMDKITTTGTVWSVVIVAVNVKIGKLSGCDFHDVGHEIIRNAIRSFTKKAGWVVADRVEITKSDGGKIGVGSAEIF